jgi:hypothetical protein
MPGWTQMARSTARISAGDKVANLDLSRGVRTVAIWSAMALQDSPLISTVASQG